MLVEVTAGCRETRLEMSTLQRALTLIIIVVILHFTSTVLVIANLVFYDLLPAPAAEICFQQNFLLLKSSEEFQV